MARVMVNGLGHGLHGDKTTTGAICLGSLPYSTQGGRGVLRLGDRTTECPKCGKVGTLVETAPTILWNGKRAALHGALIQCDCPAGSNRLIALKEQAAARSAVANPLQTTAGPSSPQPFAPPATAAGSASSVSGASAVSTADDNDPAEPGFYIVQKSISRSALEAELFGDSPSPELMRKFNGLNGSLGNDIVKAGQLVVLGDPRNFMCMREEAHLMQVAEEVAVALKDLDPEDADFMVKYRGEIAAILGETSTWAGVTATVLEKHVRNITHVLLELEKLHKNTYQTYGHLRVPDFFEKRKQLLTKLDALLFNSTRVRSFTSLGNHPKLQKALRISTKSLVHNWKKAGGPGKIPGYSNYVKSMSKAADYMKNGGFIAIGVGGISSALIIKETCTTESDEECTRIVMKEGSKFSFSTLGGLAAGWAASSLKICLGRSQKLSVTGYAVCTIAVVGGASFTGAHYGGKLGELTGETIHDHFLRD